MSEPSITRQQLTRFLGDDQGAIRAFETLFRSININLDGDVTGNGLGTIITTIAPSAVTLGKMSDLPAHTLIGNALPEGKTPQALTSDQVTALLDLFTDILKGLVPPSGGGITKYLRADGGWAIPPAAGPAGGDLSGSYPNPLVGGIQGHALPGPTVGYLNWTGTAWVFTATPYTLPVATPTVLGGVKPDGTSILNASGVISATAASVGALPSGGTASDSSKLGGVIAASYATQTWVSASYAPLASPNFTGKPHIAAPPSAGTAEIDIFIAGGGDVLALGTTGATYSGLAWLSASKTFMYSPTDFYGGGASANAVSFIWSGPIQAQFFKVGGNQVLGAQQTGLGATLASTHCGATYTATEQGIINALIDKVVLLETKLKTHGMVAT